MKKEHVKMLKRALIPKSAKDRLGECYYVAGLFASSHKDSVLVHGTIFHPLYSKHGPIPHGWVEVDDGTVFEPIGAKFWEPGDFEANHSPVVFARYEYHETLKKLVEESTWGSWDALSDEADEAARRKGAKSHGG